MGIEGGEEGALPLLAAALRGEPLAGVERALDMAMFSFGPDVPWLDAFGDREVRPKFGLHVQCPFRLGGNGEVILSDKDIRRSSEGGAADKFLQAGWAREGEPTVFDAKVRSLNLILGRLPPVVLGVEMDRDGDLSISLSRDLSINLMPPRQRTGEAWRLFETMGRYVVFP